MENVTIAKTGKKNTEEKKPVSKELQEKFIVLVIEDENFVISLEHVSEIVIVTEITPAPHQPSWVRGIMNLRDTVISLIDTRKRLGIKSVLDNVLQAISDAKEAHINWIKQLEDSLLDEGIPFNLSLDPHGCTFGKWLDATLADTNTKDDIKRKLRDTVEPHRLIHETGAKAIELLKVHNSKTEALELLKKIKEVYVPKILALFDDITNVLIKRSEKEISVILEYNGVNFAMLADAIQKMKTFAKERRQKGSLTDSPFVIGVYDDEDGLYQELDLKGILSGVEKDIANLSNHAGVHNRKVDKDKAEAPAAASAVAADTPTKK